MLTRRQRASPLHSAHLRLIRLSGLIEYQRRRVQQLNNGLKSITDQANRRAVALLDEYSDLASGGKWHGKRLAMFETPYLIKPPSILEQRGTKVAEIDASLVALWRNSPHYLTNYCRIPTRQKHSKKKTWMR